MDKITVVIRRDTGAIEITPMMVEEALNYYLGVDASVTVFEQPRTGNGAKVRTCGCKDGEKGIHANFCLFYDTPKGK